MIIMKQILYSFLLLSLLLIACSGNSYFKLPIKEISFVNKTDMIVYGNVVAEDLLGAEDILICDTFLVLHTSNPQAYLKIYSTNSLKQICSIGKQGRAGNEFINPRLIGYSFKEKNDIIIPLIDNGVIFKNLNLSKSVLENNAVIQSVSKEVPLRSTYCCPISNDFDRQFVYYRASRTATEDIAPKYYIKDGKKEHEITVFPKIVRAKELHDARTSYFSSFCHHPHRDIIIQSFECRDYLIVLNLEDKSFHAIHEEGTPSFDDFLDPSTFMIDGKDLYHFVTGVGVEDFVLFLYGAGDYCIKSDNYDPYLTPREILLFDWEGDYLGGFKLNVAVQSIAYDKIKKILYGLNFREERLYSFNLSGYIEKYEKM